MTRRIRVAVVAGGRSSEHEISLASARWVLAALDPERYDNATTVQRLLEKGAEPNLVSTAGVSPLMRAAQIGGGDAVRLLLAAGRR